MQETTPLKKKSRHWRKPVVLSIVLILLVAVGVIASLWQRAADEAAAQRKATEILVAKVTSLEAAQQRVASPDEAITTTKPEQTNSSGTQNGTSSGVTTSSPVATAIAYSRAQHGSENATLNGTVVKQSGAFARVGITTDSTGGYACVLKQSDGIWLVIFCGQAAPLPNQLAPWGVPADMLDGLQ